jgi:hypothetical protein
VTVKVNTADFPGATVALVGFEVTVKVAASTWKLRLTGVAAA